LGVDKLAGRKAPTKAKADDFWKYCLYFSSDNTCDVLELMQQIVRVALDKHQLNPLDECCVRFIPPVSKAKPYRALRLESKGTHQKLH